MRRTWTQFNMTEAEAERAHKLGTDDNGIVRRYSHKVDKTQMRCSMDALGPTLELAPPAIEQEFKDVAYSCASGLSVFHAAGLENYDVKESNTAWLNQRNRSSVALLDVDTASPLDRKSAARIV
ncbi:hypothetical protein COCSUDRAFT_39378 [Coccomyxa subellipsoidea C-169]|uniref:Protein kinase domain-containing protein n=1 Tax=Coccomyxa subellipsoidea (strain C-169) TaxID=574566 RepID=I0ZAZ0_COCSC|nr:hypothetical protein COCSUDRAFT_39378 [Coccomyxa subellipsoidea C-169]EIE27809.1 hypothetical protein COCSUDRAFT_39378 [Coccomyxa subellipsoidea C-169]|eukprot:XP_005652353.1 hypothetical protein COCSUDRAFT_39378 [Coccomyxa subellipsoidea C-169]